MKKYELPGMEGGKEYTFKITTKDASGNESVGVVKSIRLPQTGVGVGLLIPAPPMQGPDHGHFLHAGAAAPE